MNVWTILWLTWGAAFLAIELPAVLNKRAGDTLSEHVWAWFHVHDHRPTPLTWTLRGLLLAFLAWLLIHLGFGIWPSS